MKMLNNDPSRQALRPHNPLLRPLTPPIRKMTKESTDEIIEKHNKNLMMFQN